MSSGADRWALLRNLCNSAQGDEHQQRCAGYEESNGTPHLPRQGWSTFDYVMMRFPWALSLASTSG